MTLVATVIWRISGKIPLTLDITGCIVNTELNAETQGQDAGAAKDGIKNEWVVCFIDSSRYSAEQIKDFNKNVSIKMPDNTTFKGTIGFVSPHPLSKDEARQFIEKSEWVAEQCANSNYSWGVAISVDDDISEHVFTTPQVTIITEEVPPIRFLTR